MKHPSDDDLVLHFYGEDAAHAGHLAGCADCASRYRSLALVLQAVTADEEPVRGEQYGLEVWQRIRHRLPEREPWWRTFWSWQVVAATATAAILIAVGFAAGRLWPSAPASEIATRIDPGVAEQGTTKAGGADSVRRVLLLSVADHLERSERMLTDIVNAPGGIDISADQQWATDLVTASRLYRQDAIDSKEISVAAVLDELERTLLDIVHRPSRATAADLDEIRRRIDSVALLFKVRVMSTQLRELTDSAQPPSTPTRGTI